MAKCPPLNHKHLRLKLNIIYTIFYIQMNSVTDINCDDWEFIYDKPTDEYPRGYYIHKPTQVKYNFKPGIKEIVGEKNEQYIYDMWWVANG